jgi:hypothetical protein
MGSAEGGHAESHGGWGVSAPVDLGELVLSVGEADLGSFGFANPAIASRSASAMRAVWLSRISAMVTLCGVGPVQRAPEAAGARERRGWRTRGRQVPVATLRRSKATEEFFPFGVAGGAVFLGGCGV